MRNFTPKLKGFQVGDWVWYVIRFNKQRRLVQAKILSIENDSAFFQVEGARASRKLANIFRSKQEALQSL